MTELTPEELEAARAAERAAKERLPSEEARTVQGQAPRLPKAPAPVASFFEGILPKGIPLPLVDAEPLCECGVRSREIVKVQAAEGVFRIQHRAFCRPCGDRDFSLRWTRKYEAAREAGDANEMARLRAKKDAWIASGRGFVE